MVDFDQFGTAAFLASERAAARVRVSRAVDWVEILYFGTAAGTPGSSYLASVVDVPGHHDDSDGGLE